MPQLAFDMAAVMPCTLAAAQGARAAQGPAIRARADAPRAAAVFGRRRQAVLTRSSRLIVSASGDADADAELEARLQKYTGTKDWKKEKAAEGKIPAAAKGASLDAASADWGEEVVFYEGPPSYGDLATNLALGFTLLWLPLTLAAVGRSAWVYYKVTDKRVSVKSTSPLNNNQLDASYAQMTEVRAIGRGLGLWGDMVIVLKDGSKIEIRSIDKWQDIKKYIEDRMAEAQAIKEAGWAARNKSSGGASKGFGSADE